MTQPSLDAVRLKNKMFFSILPYGADQKQTIRKEGDDWVLHLVTAPGTQPVYRIMEDMSLSYLRHE